MKALKMLKVEMLSLKTFLAETDYDDVVVSFVADSATEKDFELFQSLRDHKVELEHSIEQLFKGIVVYGDVSTILLKHYTVEKLLTYSPLEGELYVRIRNNSSEDSFIAATTITAKGELSIRRILRKVESAPVAPVAAPTTLPDYLYGMPVVIFQHNKVEIELEEAIEASSDPLEIKALKKALKEHLAVVKNWDVKLNPRDHRLDSGF